MSPSLSKPSHTSPTPSPLISVWFGLGVVRQLSDSSGTPSPSVSVDDVSHASPIPSASESDWSGLDTVRQLSVISTEFKLDNKQMS